MTKYTIEGYEVEVIRELNPGFLYTHIYDYEGIEEIDKEICYAEKLYDYPPTLKLHEEIKRLTDVKDKMGQQIQELDKQHYDKAKLLKDIKQLPFLQMAMDYINGNYKYVMYLNNYYIKSKDRIYQSNSYTITYSEKGGLNLRIEDSNARIYQSMEDAQADAKKLFMEKVEKETKKTDGYNPWSSSTIADMLRKVDQSSGLQQDAEVLAFITKKKAEAKEREDANDVIKLQKEIDDKQKLLNKIKKTNDE